MAKAFELKKEKLYRFTGGMAAVATPFDKHGKLDINHIYSYAKYLVRIGVKGVYIIGTTGEGYSLALNEKISLIQAWRKAIDSLPNENRLVAVVNVSSTVVSEIFQLAAKVEELNFDGVALLPPIYYQATTICHLTKYIKQILDKCAQNTPFLYYHIPSFTNELKFELEDFIEHALNKIPQFVALKYTDSNIVRFASIQSKFGDKVNIFAGFEETLLATKLHGGRAAIGATFSFVHSSLHYQSLIEAFEAKQLEKANNEQKMITNFCASLRIDGNFFATLKNQLNKELENEGIFFGKPRSPVLIE